MSWKSSCIFQSCSVYLYSVFVLVCMEVLLCSCSVFRLAGPTTFVEVKYVYTCSYYKRHCCFCLEVTSLLFGYFVMLYSLAISHYAHAEKSFWKWGAHKYSQHALGKKFQITVVNGLSIGSLQVLSLQIPIFQVSMCLWFWVRTVY